MSFNFAAVSELLRCPKSQSPLAHHGNALICTDAECRLKFEIRDDIPILLLDEAEEMPEADWQAAVEDAAKTQA